MKERYITCILCGEKVERKWNFDNIKLRKNNKFCSKECLWVSKLLRGNLLSKIKKHLNEDIKSIKIVTDKKEYIWNYDNK